MRLVAFSCLRMNVCFGSCYPHARICSESPVSALGAFHCRRAPSETYRFCLALTELTSRRSKSAENCQSSNLSVEKFQNCVESSQLTVVRHKRKWWALLGSNHRRADQKSVALPTELVSKIIPRRVEATQTGLTGSQTSCPPSYSTQGAID